jgi:hypothetical protein
VVRLFPSRRAKAVHGKAHLIGHFRSLVSASAVCPGLDMIILRRTNLSQQPQPGAVGAAMPSRMQALRPSVSRIRA